MILTISILWYLVGIFGFVYWWTTDYDLEIKEMFLALAVGIVGPLSFVMGFMVHGKSKFIIVKRRKYDRKKI